MAERIAIDHDLIVSHAARVEQVASDIKVARDAAASTNMGGGAFGVLCSREATGRGLAVPPIRPCRSKPASRLAPRKATGMSGGHAGGR